MKVNNENEYYSVDVFIYLILAISSFHQWGDTFMILVYHLQYSVSMLNSRDQYPDIISLPYLFVNSSYIICHILSIRYCYYNNMCTIFTRIIIGINNVILS